MLKNGHYNFFIGIDVSKNTLDVAVMHQELFLFHQTIKNQVNSVRVFLSTLVELQHFHLQSALFCMENTGHYCNHVLCVLKDLNANVVLENAYRIKHSLGLQRDKSDKSDAKRIASYAQRNVEDLRIWKPKREAILKLMNLLALRNRLVSTKVILNTPLEAQRGFESQMVYQTSTVCCTATLNALKSDLKNINRSILEVVLNDARLKRLYTLITSVPGIGIITAIQILVSTNEFLDFDDPKKFACYAGVVPFRIQSGTILTKPKVSHIANKKIKKMLHTCAIVAITHNEELKDYYLRKTQQNGKPKMSVLNAVRNKLVLRIFSCVNHDRLYSVDYKRL